MGLDMIGFCVLIAIWLAFIGTIWVLKLRHDSTFLRTSKLFQKKVLLLDLDETLIHSTLKMPSRYDFKLTVNVPIGGNKVFFVIKRPHLDLFLYQVSQWYHVFIFTAGLREYADPLINVIDRHGYIQGRYFRDSCTCQEGLYIKHLQNVNVNLSQTILIDNQPISYRFNEENAIPIPNFYEDINDEALLNMLPLLDSLRYVQDVRSILSLRMLASG